MDRVDNRGFDLKRLNIRSFRTVHFDSSPESSRLDLEGGFLVNLFTTLILSIGLSSVFSSFLQAAVRVSRLESDSITKEAMDDFIDIGSSLNERFVSKVSES